MAGLNYQTLEELIDQHGAMLYRLCYRLATNKADADDLYQETFLKAVERSQRIDAGRNPRGYLASIAVYLWRSQRRKAARRQRLAPLTTVDALELPADSAGPEQSLLDDELGHSIRQAVNDLDDRLRVPLYLHYTLDMAVDEIASTLKIPVGTVKSRLHQARKLIKKRLEALE